MCEDYSSSVEKVLAKRETKGLKRSLFIPHKNSIDFTSNDYLGFSRDRDLEKKILRAREQQRFCNFNGSTGSRLLSGNNSFYERVERFLTSFHDGEDALLFNSGYDLNLGLIGCIASKSDAFLFDSLCHNSIREGLKLTRAFHKVSFEHNDIGDFTNKIERLRNDSSIKNIFVVVESVYSMDGDCASIGKILSACEKYKGMLLIDEAHGLGILGNKGCGLLQGLNLHSHPSVLCRIYTFGKALGTHGAVAILSPILKEYLLNYCRPLIYSTSLSYHSLTCILVGYEHLAKVANERQMKLNSLINAFIRGMNKCNANILYSSTAVQGVIVPGNKNVVKVTKALQLKGFDVRPIRSPTVPAGKERIRIVLHYHNTVKEVESLCCEIVNLLSSTQMNIGASL